MIFTAAVASEITAAATEASHVWETILALATVALFVATVVLVVATVKLAHVTAQVALIEMGKVATNANDNMAEVAQAEIEAHHPHPDDDDKN